MSKNKYSIIELFAGVGGFRVGFDRADKEFFQTIWSNQYEPAIKTQHASQTYVARFGAEGHVNEDIAKVPTDEIPDHDLLCGGFPCQDYSVARTLSQAAGLEGKKDVLWWQIERICREKGDHAGIPIEAFLMYVDAIAWQEDVKYTTLGKTITSDVGRKNNMLTYARFIACLLGRSSYAEMLNKFSMGVSNLQKNEIATTFPELNTSY